MSAPANLKQIIVAEYKKCAEDPVYFMKKYCHIQHPVKGKMLFNLYPFQEKALIDISQNKYELILKSRQLGISTLVAGYSLWKMTFNEDFNVLVIATNREVAKNLVTKVRVMYDYLPSWLREQSDEDNKLSLRLKNGSQIKAISSTGTSGRSEALSLLVLDEAAFIDKVDDIWTSSQQALSTGGQCIALSTPNGTGNWFHKRWVAAHLPKLDDNDIIFNTLRLHWSVHPERDMNWRKQQDVLLGVKMAAQECDADFISSGNTLIEGELIKWYEERVEEPVQKRGPGGELWIWKFPDYSRDYMLIADVARGDGLDYSAFHVIDIEACEQVAEYRGLIGTKDYGHMLVNVATEYNNALLVIENANIGWAAIQPALDREYNNLYYTYRHDGVVDQNIQIQKGYDMKEKSQSTPGFTTSVKTRPLLVSKLDIYTREKACIIKSQRLVDEWYVFIWKGSKCEAQSGYNDDLTMAFSIGLYIRDYALKIRNDGIELNRNALRLMHKSGGSSGVYTNSSITNQWNMRLQNKETEELNWLL